MSEPSGRRGAFDRLVGLDDARERLLAAVEPIDRTERVPIREADGRVLAEELSAVRSVPHYPRAAMDGYAVRATDVAGASDGAPVVLDLGSGTEEPVDAGTVVEPGTAVPVGTGEELPAGADTVVRVERAERTDDGIAVTEPVAEGKDVAPVGEDVGAGERLYDAGHRFRPSDLGLAKSVGRESVEVFARPTAAVLPTGSELVHRDPAPGEVVETNGLTVARFVERWGGEAAYRDVVHDDAAAIEAAIAGELWADLIVTTGGSSVGERDLVPEVVEAMGELLVHGVGIKPGHPVAVGVVEGTPVLALPGYPVSAIVTAVQLLRPALSRAGRISQSPHPWQRARLVGEIESERGVRSFERVRVAERDGEPIAVPVRAAGAGVLSSVGLADGWVTVPESRAELPAGSRVDVEDWEPFA